MSAYDQFQNYHLEFLNQTFPERQFGGSHTLLLLKQQLFLCHQTLTLALTKKVALAPFAVVVSLWRNAGSGTIGLDEKRGGDTYGTAFLGTLRSSLTQTHKTQTSGSCEDKPKSFFKQHTVKMSLKNIWCVITAFIDQCAKITNTGSTISVHNICLFVLSWSLSRAASLSISSPSQTKKYGAAFSAICWSLEKKT